MYQVEVKSSAKLVLPFIEVGEDWVVLEKTKSLKDAQVEAALLIDQIQGQLSVMTHPPQVEYRIIENGNVVSQNCI